MKTLSLPTSNSLRVTNSLRQARPRIPISASGDYTAASLANVGRHLHTRSTSPLGSGTVLQFSAMRQLLAPGHHHRAVGFAAPRAPSALPSPLPRPAAPRGRSQNPSCPQRRHRQRPHSPLNPRRGAGHAGDADKVPCSLRGRARLVTRAASAGHQPTTGSGADQRPSAHRRRVARGSRAAIAKAAHSAAHGACSQP